MHPSRRLPAQVTVTAASLLALLQILVLFSLLGRASAVPLPLDRTDLQAKYRAAAQRIFFLDYDGTLAPIPSNRADKVSPQPAIHALTKLAADPRNTVWIVTGRRADSLDKQLTPALPGVGFAAEFGSLVRWPGATEWENLARERGVDMSWYADAAARLDAWVKQNPGTSLERKTNGMTLHYKNAANPDCAQAAAEAYNDIQDKVVAKHPGIIEVVRGATSFDVRPSFTDKGKTVQMLLAAKSSVPAFAFAAGDDAPDEDMFEALGAGRKPGHFTVTVGSEGRSTAARFWVHTPKDLLKTLAALGG